MLYLKLLKTLDIKSLYQNVSACLLNKKWTQLLTVGMSERRVKKGKDIDECVTLLDL